MSRRKVSTTIYITPEQNEQLKALHDATKVPIAEYIRQGIDLILERHRQVIPGHQPSLFGNEGAAGMTGTALTKK